MKAPPEQPLRQKVSWLRVLWPGRPSDEGEDVDPGGDRPDCSEKDRAEAELFWAGRTLAMRRSARVAA
jgi:hypothetical protein